MFMIIPQGRGKKGFSFFATHIIKFVKKLMFKAKVELA